MWSVPGLGWGLDGLSFARALNRYLRHSRQQGDPPFDLIDAHFVYPDGVGAWLAGRQWGIPVVVTVRGKIVSLSRRALRRMQIRAMLRGVAGRIAVSRSLAGWIHRVGGSDLAVDVIPNGIDARTFHMVDRARAREILGWRTTGRYLLCVGHMQRLKGFDRIVSALPAIRSAEGDVRLMLAGSQRGERSFRKEIHHLMRSCNAAASISSDEPCVTFTGPVAPEELNLMYNAADLTVNASRGEGWCNAIAESLAAGTPVVATDVGGNREQIRTPDLGRIVPEDDVDTLADSIIDALRTRWDRRIISSFGTARTWSHVASEIAAVFQRVLAGHQQAANINRHAPQEASLPAPPLSHGLEARA